MTEGFLPALFLAAALPLIVAPAIAQTAPSAFTTGYRYDAGGRLTGQVSADPDGAGPLHYAATRNTYDAAGRLTRTETGELASWQSETVAPSAWSGFTVATVTDITYDGFGNPTARAISFNGTTYALTQYSYDAERRLSCATVRMNSAAFASRPDACTLGTQGGLGPDRITKNVYDTADQLIQVRKGVGTPLEEAYATYSYTPNGKREYVIDANGNRAKLSWDGFDRQAGWYFPSPTKPSAFNGATQATALATAGASSTTDYEAYGYDANGNRTSLRKRDGRTIAYSFDALNRMSLKHPAAGSDTYYGYDNLGHQLYARFSSANGQGITEAYDGLGRKTSSTNNMGGVSRALTYQYDADDNRTRVTFPDATYFTYVYDGLDRPTTIQQSGSTTIATETWDAQGRRSAETRGAVSIGYGYDPISRLASLSNDLAGTAQDVTTSFTYTPASEIATEARSNDSYAWTGAVNVNRAYATNGLNQYSAIAGATQSYDANGNMLSGGGVTYGYDIENRLVSASNGVSLTYDPLGHLFQTTGGSAGTTQYLYDGDALVAEYNGSGTLLRRYVHGNDEDDPMLWYEGAGLTDMRSLQVDEQGSIVSIANSAGTVSSIDTYDEYGIPGSGNAGRFQYTGQAWLPELGLYYYKARIYSPTLGRFLQTDPIGYKDQINLYAYVGNDPVNHNDPTGQSWLSDLAGDIAQIPSDIGDAASHLAHGDVGYVLGGLPPDLGGGFAGEAGTAARISAVEAEAGEAAGAERTFQTYTKTNPETGKVYTGRTSGTGTPAQNIARRDASHVMTKEGYGPARLDKSSSNAQAIRGREQQMIEKNGGAQSQGGTSGNKINGVSPTNPNADAYRAAAKKEFGSE